MNITTFILSNLSNAHLLTTISHDLCRKMLSFCKFEQAVLTVCRIGRNLILRS